MIIVLIIKFKNIWLSNLSASFKLRFVDNFQIEEFVVLLTALPESQTISPQLQATTQHAAFNVMPT